MGLSPRRAAVLVITCCLAALAAEGCNPASVFPHNDRYLTEQRKANGLVVILPGIEGVSEYNQDIRRGLISGGVNRALPIYSWGRPVPLAGPLINQMDFVGNRLAGTRISRMILSYQEQYPGRPVVLVGHSGGGGVAVFAAEAMPEGHQVDALVLLSPSISADYDLSKALAHCRNGIINFYNPQDKALLGVGTTIVGNVDGGHGPSAGLKGFTRNPPGLQQIRVTGAMTGYDTNAHTATTGINFVARYVAPRVLASGGRLADMTASSDGAKPLAGAARRP